MLSLPAGCISYMIVLPQQNFLGHIFGKLFIVHGIGRALTAYRFDSALARTSVVLSCAAELAQAEENAN